MSSDNNLQGLSLLLVDDDTDVRGFLALSLEEEGASVTQCMTAEEGLEALKQQSFDAVATDMNLPGMDGINLLRVIRQNYGELPVILITGYSSVGSAVDALKLGAQDYLTKPLSSADALTGSIIKAVDHFKLSKRHKALQERLIRAEKMESIGTLVGGVAHELNNILSPMVTLPEIIQMQLKDVIIPAAVRVSIEEFLMLIRSSGKTAAALVSDLLSSTTQASYKKTSEDICELVTGIVASQEIQEIVSSSGGLKIETQLEEGVPEIMCSRHHVARVTTNLVRNAAEAIFEKNKGRAVTDSDHVKIAISRVQLNETILGFDMVPAGEYILIEVSDTGAGIEKENISRIFEPFFSNKKRTNHSGSGLGLSVVHGVVKDHGGAIDVRSEQGEGTVFKLYFPLIEVAQKPVEEGEAPIRGGSERILVIDDSPVQRILADKILSNLGYNVSTVSTGREAVSKFQKSKSAGLGQPFDLILLDMIIEEDFDGLAAYEAISALFPDIKTIVLTAYATSERVETLLDLDAYLLMKPYESKDLAEAVRSKLDVDTDN